MNSKEQVGELSTRVSSYERWVKTEGIPVNVAYFVEDLTQLKLEPWTRTGGKGCYLNLIGNEQTSDSYVCEIEPGKSLKPEKHMFEELVLILQGRGATLIWNEGGRQQTFEWQEGSLFALPLNAWHQHFNGQGDKPVKFVGATNAPIIINLYHNLDFIFNNSYVFKDRFGGEEDYFSGQGKLYGVAGVNIKLWETNFITDVRTFKLGEVQHRGGSGSGILLEMAEGTMSPHISEFSPGQYKKAHRHAPGANVIMVSGQGYSLMWPEGGQKVFVPWHKGSLFTPPGRWFHQHFNTGSEPARYVALKFTGSLKYPLGIKYFSSEIVKRNGDQIEYDDEDPEIKKLFQAECSKTEVAFRKAPLLVQE